MENEVFNPFGEWIKADNVVGLSCSVCGCRAPVYREKASEYNGGFVHYVWESKYCPHCGAEMKSEYDG